MNDRGNNLINIVATEGQELIAPYGLPNPAAKTVASGANDFAFRLSAALAEEVGDENFVCSPYSVWMPLAALINAMDARARHALLAALSASGVSSADINTAASRMLYDLTNASSKQFADDPLLEGMESCYDPLKIANAIFVDKSVTLKKDFAQTFMDFYRGNAINVDFTSKDAVDAVNKWASENTDGLITDIVSDFPRDAVATIANAIYFSDRWDREFDPKETAENVFHAPEGDVPAFYMLREMWRQTYYEDEKIQALPLQFSTGGGLYILLPKNGNATGLLSKMTKTYFDEIQKKSVQAKGKLLLPRFSIESSLMSLSVVLGALGVPLFDGSIVSLSDGLIEEDFPVWFSDAIQKAVIRVDEKGTTAAAVTVIALCGAAMMPDPTETFEMICDKPFVFILYGNTCDGGSQVLFTGIVNRPGESG